MPHMKREPESINLIREEPTMKNNIINAVFTSIWDDGIIIRSRCRVNMDKKFIIDVEKVNAPVEDLIDEYVEVNGVRYPACPEAFRSRMPGHLYYSM